MDAKHSYSNAEKRGYVEFINADMADDPDVGSSLPIDPMSDQIFDLIAEGVLLNKMINKTFENTIDETKICKKSKKSQFEKNINNDFAIEGAIKIGCSVVNIGAADLQNKVPHLVMGLLWQIIKRCLMAQIERNMDISRLAEADETIEKVPPEQILLRWFNYHLKRAGHHRLVTNFSEDISDGENYAVLLAQIAPDVITSDDLDRAFRAKPGLDRATVVLQQADKIHCKLFVTPQDIVDGNPRLNLAFVATLFKKYPSLGPTAEEIANRKAQDLQGQLEEIEAMLAEANNERDSLQSELDKTKLDFDALTEELGSLTLDLENMTNEKEQIFNEKCDLEKLLEVTKQEKGLVETELLQTKQQKEDLFAQLQQEISFKIDLETELNDTKVEFENFKRDTSAEISALTEQLETEISLKTQFSTKLEETISELERTKNAAANRESELLDQLATEIKSKESLQSELDSTRRELADTQRLAKEAEQTKDDLFKLLTDTISELETTKENAKQREAELEARLAEEIASKESYIKKLREVEDEYARAKADWEEERARLLKRIKELEGELERLRNEMRIELEKMEKEKQEALALAEAEKRKALHDAEHEKNLALDKVRLLLKGNQRSGYLYFQQAGIFGETWRKRFFVLKDNLLSWYKNESKIGTKPVGVIYCDEARLYEIEEKDIGKENVFQLDTGKVRYYVAAETMDEMKEWMNEIRVAKKKKWGVKVVSEEKSGGKKKVEDDD